MDNLKLIPGRKVNANKTEKTSSLQARAITDHDQNDPKNDHVDQNCLNDQDNQYQYWKVTSDNEKEQILKKVTKKRVKCRSAAELALKNEF